jgi:hypothetical protein
MKYNDSRDKAVQGYVTSVTYFRQNNPYPEIKNVLKSSLLFSSVRDVSEKVNSG